MKQTSVPEQTIFYYAKKLIDSKAENNTVRIGRYTADVTFSYHGNIYDVEYDCFSTHSEREEKDIERDKVFIEAGYTIIRMRDKGLTMLPRVVNITFDFQNYSKKSIHIANEGINLFLSLFGVKELVDIGNDLETIKKMYHLSNV